MQPAGEDRQEVAHLPLEACRQVGLKPPGMM